jgi:AcrR family transcriptional regulator
MAKAATAAVDKRRQILDAAVRVFARQGFHSTRVSDIADEAGVAYGLVYHYFKSKDEVLNELFSERWSLLLAAIEEVPHRGRSWKRSPASSSTPTVMTPS